MASCDFFLCWNNVGNGMDGSTRSYVNCKILLPKFNTWKQGQIERKKGSLSPFYNTVDSFSAKKFCHYSVIASRLHRNGVAISP